MPFESLITEKSALDSAAVMQNKVVEEVDHIAKMPLDKLLETLTHGAIDIGIKIVAALVIYYIGRWLIRRMRRTLDKVLEKKHMEVSLRSFLTNLVNITLVIVLITIIVGILGINTTSFVAIFASAGLAVGMALSGTLQNFAGGVMILALRPFRVGDTIEAMGQTGTVREIRLFNTVLNTGDNKTIIIPNGGISTSIVNNYSAAENRRVDWTFGIAYGDNYDTARATILELLAADSRVLKDPAVFIALHSLADSSVNIVVRAWAHSADYWGVYFDLNEKVYKTFSDKGLNIPFPQMDVHVKKD